MGFLYHALRFPAITVFFFVDLWWSQLKWMAFAALSSLGIYKPSSQDDDDNDSSNTSTNSYIFLLEGISPSLVPIPIQVIISAIKSKVPVVEYRYFLLRRLSSDQPQQKIGEEVDGDGDGDGEGVVVCNLCTICLESLEPTQQVRDLSRCNHAFHKVCLDTWVNSGQITCPVCRSMLLPPNTNLSNIQMRW